MPTHITDTHDLLGYQLAATLAAEKHIERLLDRAQQEVNAEELRQGFRRHRDETREHAKRLEQAMKELGATPVQGTSAVSEAFLREYEEFGGLVSEDVTADVLDGFTVAAAQKVEHFEIAAYTAMTALAESSGETEVSKLLQQTLKEEQRMLGEVERAADKLGKQVARDVRA